jgi:hypothetical protein
MARMTEDTPLPPLDLRGLPSTDAYGNKVNLPEADSSGMPTLRGPMPGAAVAPEVRRPSSVPSSQPSTPIVGDPNSPENLAKRARDIRLQEFNRMEQTPAQLRPSQAPGGTPMPAPAPKSQTELQGERMRSDYEQNRRMRGNAGKAAYDDAFQEAIRLGSTEAEAKRIAVDAAGVANARGWAFSGRESASSMLPPGVGGGAAPMEQEPGFGPDQRDVYTTRMMDETGAVTIDRGERPGAVRGGPQVIATPEGPQIRGTAGATFQFAQDPISGNVLPISNMYSQQEYIDNLDEATRANTISVLSEGNDPVSQQFQRIESDMQRVDADPRLSPRQRMMAKDRLRQEQDGLLWSSMRDPSQLLSSRRRQQAEREAETERENRQSIAIQERLAKQRQQQNARMYQDAYKRAKQELETDPFRPVSEDEIRNRAQQLYMQQASETGAMSPQSQAAAAQPAPAKSGAPDLSNQNIAIEPGSPIDFQQAPNGALVTMIPNPDDPARPTMMRAANFNGRAVAVPRNQAELDLLPPGSLYILEGAVRRGEMREPKRKEGEVPGLQGASAETPEAQDFAIRDEATKLAEPRTKAQGEYQTQKAEYDNMMQEAKNRAAQQLGVVLGRNGEPSFEAVGGGVRTGAGARSAQIDPKGQWADAVQKQMIAVAEERYGAGGKKAPEWIRRRGDEIIMVDVPQAPKFAENAEAQEMAKAREDYFAKRGTTEFKVRNERMLNEARSSYTVSLRGGRPTVQVGNRSYPGVRIREGNMQAVLPAIESGNRPPQEVANEALTLLTSGKPFAIDIGGRMVPFKLDRNDPRLKTMIEDPDKTLSLTSGRIGNSPGVKAALSYVQEVFGYLPVSARKSILDRMLTNPRLGGYTLTAD